jgi:putative membrane protein
MVMEIPRWLTKYVDGDGIETIRAAVVAAEKKTAGEIVPMIVRRSTHLRHVPWLVFLFFLAVFSALLPYVSEYLWQVIPYWALEIAAVVASGLLAGALSGLDLVRRLCTPSADLDSSVLMRAQLEFYESDLRMTKGKTGILIFVSLLEHEAVVLADEGISKQLPPETWQEVIDLLLDGVRRRDFAGGMGAAIHKCGSLLAERFPRATDDRDELPNKLIIEE